MNKSYLQFAFELSEVFHLNLDQQKTINSLFIRIKANPSLYIEPANNNVKQALLTEKRPSILLSNMSADVLQIVMSVALGHRWSRLFSLCIVDCKKPLF